MEIKKKTEVPLEVTGIAFGGRGIAKVDGYTIFIDGAVPGDTVLARILKKKKSYAEARAIEVISPSADRVDPPCRYSGHCGGCRWQYLVYDRQLEYKRQHVVEALERIGQLSGIPVHETLPSERIFGYRNKMEFSCSDHRWLLPEELGDPGIDTDFALGLHVPGTFDKILDIDECHLHPEQGNRILNAVRKYMKSSGMPPYAQRAYEGFWRFLMLRHSVAHDQWLVNVITAADAPDVLGPLATQLMADHPNIAGVVNNVTGRKASVAVGEREILVAGESYLKEKLGPFEFEVSANSFFQTNTRGAEKIYETVRRYAELSGTETVLDLYSGTGTIPIWLSRDAGTVTGIEIVESAVADAVRNCRNNGIDNCEFITGDIRESIGSITRKPDVLIIDPPRVGMHKDVVAAVQDMAAARVVYVSCNPATLARDLALLAEDYEIVEVQPIDMFPHTFHIESVAKLEKRK